MNVQELTKEYNKLRQDYIKTKKTVEYHEHEIKMLRLIINDMKIDIEMLVKSEMRRRDEQR